MSAPPLTVTFAVLSTSVCDSPQCVQPVEPLGADFSSDSREHKDSVPKIIKHKLVVEGQLEVEHLVALGDTNPICIITILDRHA